MISNELKEEIEIMEEVDLYHLFYMLRNKLKIAAYTFTKTDAYEAWCEHYSEDTWSEKVWEAIFNSNAWKNFGDSFSDFAWDAFFDALSDAATELGATL